MARKNDDIDFLLLIKDVFGWLDETSMKILRSIKTLLKRN